MKEFIWTDELVFEFTNFYEEYCKSHPLTWTSVAADAFKKSKERMLLFTTEDGVNIYEKQPLWIVHKDFKKIYATVSVNNQMLGQYDYRPQFGNKYFFSEEFADAYIVYNKPLLSLSNFENKLGRCATDKYLLGELKQLAQSKINNQ